MESDAFKEALRIQKSIKVDRIHLYVDMVTGLAVVGIAVSVEVSSYESASHSNWGTEHSGADSPTPCIPFLFVVVREIPVKPRRT